MRKSKKGQSEGLGAARALPPRSGLVQQPAGVGDGAGGDVHVQGLSSGWSSEGADVVGWGVRASVRAARVAGWFRADPALWVVGQPESGGAVGVRPPVAGVGGGGRGGSRGGGDAGVVGGPAGVRGVRGGVDAGGGGAAAWGGGVCGIGVWGGQFVSGAAASARRGRGWGGGEGARRGGGRAWRLGSGATGVVGALGRWGWWVRRLLVSGARGMAVASRCLRCGVGVA